MTFCKTLATIFIFYITCLQTGFALTETAPVSGFARSFLSTKPIANATITIIETGEKFTTDEKGEFGPIHYPVGKPITLLFSKSGFVNTQSDTTIVPKEGLTTPDKNITFQVPSDFAFSFLKRAMGAVEDPNSCHVASTVTALHKTLDDLVQGEAGATVKLIPGIAEKPFYFDIFLRGPFKGRTYPFDSGLTKTSADGGIAFFNVPASNKPYRLIAEKDGVKFTVAQFICKKGTFINISPPRGPMVLR